MSSNNNYYEFKDAKVAIAMELCLLYTSDAADE